MRHGRVVVGVLGGGAAALAFAVGAVSLTRFAGDYLGFPTALEWTFTGAVDIAGIAGGVMWTGFTGAIRRIGRPMNIVCTVVSGMGVGLDHATHAGRALRETGGADWLTANPAAWALIAFCAGAFIPALVAWILHALAVIADQTATPHREGRDETVTLTETPLPVDRDPLPVGADRDPSRVVAESAETLVATTGTPDREALPVGSRGGETELLPRFQQLDVAPAQQRPDWAPPELVETVERSIADTPGGRTNYGVPSLQRDHRLPDGRKIGSHRAAALLAHVDDRARLRESA